MFEVEIDSSYGNLKFTVNSFEMFKRILNHVFESHTPRKLKVNGVKHTDFVDGDGKNVAYLFRKLTKKTKPNKLSMKKDNNGKVIVVDALGRAKYSQG